MTFLDAPSTSSPDSGYDLPSPEPPYNKEWQQLSESIEVHHGALLRFARRKVASDDIAEEIVQDTWLAALNAIDSYAGRASIRTWLTSILRRKIADHYRSRRQFVSLEEARHDDRSAPSPDDVLILRERASRVMNALEELPPREREAVELCGVREFGRVEAAERMGLSRPCLRVTLCRGRAHLRELAS